MSGVNYWLLRANKAFVVPSRMSSGPCVFISYRSLDREAAMDVAEYLKSRGVNHWIDVDSKELQSAIERGDDLEVARTIEQALDFCSHLLGIVTDSTQGSYWVPYEIGSARGRGRSVGHIIHQNVPARQIPAFLKLGTPIPDQNRLDQWLAHNRIVRLDERTAHSTQLHRVLPKQRAVSI